MSDIPEWKAEIIIASYETCDINELSKKVEMKVPTIRAWARRRKLKRKVRQKVATLPVEYEDILLNEYEYGDIHDICKKLNKNLHAVHELARRRGLKRKVCQNRNGTLLPLLSGTLESYYWLGFIAGDGYISKDGHLLVSQSEKDLFTIERLSKYLNTSFSEINPSKKSFKVKNKVYRIALKDKNVGVLIRDMFGIKNNENKTTHGIRIDFVKNKDQAISFLCGLIDADGNRQKSSFRIMCHKKWLQIYENLIAFCCLENSSIKLQYRKDKEQFYCVVYFKKKDLNELLLFSKSKNLPVSKRKFY